MSLYLTVAICTYNGGQRIPAVLDALKIQSETQNISWEIIVIDNNSSDNTAQIVQEYQTNWPSTCPLRYCFEPRQGLANARQRAIQEAKGELVGFLDDDNIPAPNWVASAYTFAQEHPKAGAYGSRIAGEFEVTPPPNFDRIAPLLALTERGSEPLIYEPNKKVLPPGAGLVVRRQAWLETVPEKLVLGGRIGKDMLAGEDLEALLYIQKAGWEIWYNPQMQIRHRIPKSRLERDYLLKLCRGIGLSRYRTRMLSVKPWQQPLAFLAYSLNDLRKITKHFLKYRTAIQNDIVAASEMQLYIGSLISPFYIWKRDLQRWLSIALLEGNRELLTGNRK